MSSNAQATVRINTEAKAQMYEAIAAGVTEVATQDIWPEAVRNSRVKTGHNRRTIAVDVNAFGQEISNTSAGGEITEGVAQADPRGVNFAIYGQSGYSGWLEIGTRLIQGDHGIYNAVQKYLGRIGDAVRRHLER